MTYKTPIFAFLLTGFLTTHIATAAWSDGQFSAAIGPGIALGQADVTYTISTPQYHRDLGKATLSFAFGLSYDYPLPGSQFMLGLDLMGTYTNLKMSNTLISHVTPNDEEMSIYNKFAVSPVLKLGYQMEKVTPFLLLGATAASFNVRATSFPTGNAGDVLYDQKTTKTLWGYTLGIGINFALAPKQSLELRYSFTGFKPVTITTSGHHPNGTPYNLPISDVFTPKLHMVSLLYRYRFE